MKVFGRDNVERYAENLKENDWNQNRENNLHFAFLEWRNCRFDFHNIWFPKEGTDMFLFEGYVNGVSVFSGDRFFWGN